MRFYISYSVLLCVRVPSPSCVAHSEREEDAFVVTLNPVLTPPGVLDADGLLRQSCGRRHQDSDLAEESRVRGRQPSEGTVTGTLPSTRAARLRPSSRGR